MHSVGNSPDKRHTAIHDVTIMGRGIGRCFFICGYPSSGNISRQRPKKLRKEHLLSNTLKSTFDSVNVFASLLTTANAFFLRFERVAYLECDIGQSEFTPGGMVALNVISKHQFGTRIH